METIRTYTHENYPERVELNTRIRLVIDADYQSKGSFGLDTPEDTEAAERDEQSKLDSGDWIALARITEKQCHHCDAWSEVDSLWGIVVEYSDAGFADAAFNI